MAIKVNIVTQFDSRGIKQAQRELAQVGKSISRSLDVAVAGGLAAATAGLVGAVKASSNYLAQMTGVEQVFGKAADSVKNFAKTAAETAGLSATEALTASKQFGLFANSAGLAGQASATFATDLVQLAGDLGSFNEIPTAQVLADISSGLQGQAEPLRKYGVQLTDLKLREEAKNLAIYDGSGALNDQQKMLASYSLIMQETKIQQGDFAKYSTDLGNATKTLTGQFADLQVQIGDAVRPALAEIIPQLSALIPLIGQALKDAVASVDWKSFFTAVVGGFKFLIENAGKIATFIGIAWSLTKVFGAMQIALNLVTVATGAFGTQLLILQSSTVLGAAITVLGVFAALMISSQIGVDKETEALKNNIYYQKKFNDAKKEGVKWSDVAAQLGGTTTAMRQLAGETARYGALAKTPLPTSGGTPKTIAQIIAEMGNLGSATTKLDTAEKKRIAAQKKAAAAAKKAAEEALAATKKQEEALANFSQGIKDVVKGLGELAKSTNELGQFEQQAVSTFESINKAIAAGITDRTITDEAANNLLSYIAVEKVALTALARQRDVLLKKIDIAKSISSSFVEAANITNTESKQVTKAVTTMVNGITTTIKTTFNEVLAGDITASFKKIVDRTKNFAKNLVILKKLGLNGSLFKQIVDAGSEAGGATAEAIIAGGADTISELNGLFDELNQAGSDIASESTDTFYNLGEGIGNAFVDGLKSQEQYLADEIAKMVASIEAAFNAMTAKMQGLSSSGSFSTGVASKYNPLTATGTPVTNLGNMIRGVPMMANGGIVMPSIGGSLVNVAEAGVPEAIIPLNKLGKMGGQPIYITVNAGLGTNGKAVGQEIQALLNQYARAN